MLFLNINNYINNTHFAYPVMISSLNVTLNNSLKNPGTMLLGRWATAAGITRLEASHHQETIMLFIIHTYTAKDLSIFKGVATFVSQ